VVRHGHAREDADQGAFPCAVLAHEGMDLAAPEVERRPTEPGRRRSSFGGRGGRGASKAEVRGDGDRERLRGSLSRGASGPSRAGLGSVPGGLHSAALAWVTSVVGT
jgi:hypothetical protein